MVVLSTRHDPELWWQSGARRSSALTLRSYPRRWPNGSRCGGRSRSARFTPRWTDKNAAIAAYERHNAQVRASAPSGRLVEWQPEDGWGPLCEALGVAAPDGPFPHLNRREDFPRADRDVSLPEAIERLRQEGHGAGH